MCGLSNWEEIIKKLDLNGDGSLDYHEFITAAVDKKKLFTEENIRHAFNIFDTNGDGKIGLEEFKIAMPILAGDIEDAR